MLLVGMRKKISIFLNTIIVMKKINLFLFFLFVNTTQCLAQSNEHSNNFFENNRDFIEKAIVALISGTLVFIINYFLAIRKEKRDSKELSYTIQIDELAKREDSPIKSDIKIAFKDSVVEDLSFVTCNIKNTGILVVKNEELRFTFDTDCNILEDYVFPISEPEIGFTKLEINHLRHEFERKYKIAHLVPNKDITLNFVISGTKNQPIIHDFNEDGDVIVNETTKNKKRSQERILNNFIYVNFIIFILNRFLGYINNYTEDEFLELIIGLVNLSFVVFNLKLAIDVSKIIAEIIFGFINKGRDSSINIVGNSNVVFDEAKFQGSTIKIANHLKKDESASDSIE